MTFLTLIFLYSIISYYYCKCCCCASEYKNTSNLDISNNDSNENNKYFLRSGYDINLQLNVEYHDCNCQTIGIIRLFSSDKYFYIS